MAEWDSISGDSSLNDYVADINNDIQFDNTLGPLQGGISDGASLDTSVGALNGSIQLNNQDDSVDDGLTGYGPDGVPSNESAGSGGLLGESNTSPILSKLKELWGKISSGNATPGEKSVFDKIISSDRALAALIGIGGQMMAGASRNKLQEKAWARDDQIRQDTWAREDQIRAAERARRDANSYAGTVNPIEYQKKGTGLLETVK